MEPCDTPIQFIGITSCSTSKFLRSLTAVYGSAYGLALKKGSVLLGPYGFTGKTPCAPPPSLASLH